MEIRPLTKTSWKSDPLEKSDSEGLKVPGSWGRTSVTAVPGEMSLLLGVLSDVSVGFAKRAISTCLTYSLWLPCRLATPFVDCCNKRPLLFGKPVSLWRQITTALWRLEPHGFIPQRFDIVSTNKETGNVIVRSSLPFDESGSLAIDNILEELNTKLGRTGADKLTIDSIHLDLYTLQNRVCEHEEWERLESEVAALQKKNVSISFNPSPISGTVMGPICCLPKAVQDWYQKNVPYYLTWTHFSGLVDKLLQKQSRPRSDGKLRVSLLHCAHGIDRTGMLSAAIKMSEGATYKEAREEACRFAQTRSGYNDLDSFAHHGLQNFALFLKACGKGEHLGNLDWDYHHKVDQRKQD
ncbi:hypothetical protein [Parendozoicomonas sp. Alg238-R29]|uniref:hypothetical protein n=1 Tax=Parendozoicomonas sp. Alg238-R29 TaxID=2993446 RepID=UPI00248EAFBD|nr:hypothetical protein [Parendozoicomonas sp. Alg238-R29]